MVEARSSEFSGTKSSPSGASTKVSHSFFSRSTPYAARVQPPHIVGAPLLAAHSLLGARADVMSALCGRKTQVLARILRLQTVVADQRRWWRIRGLIRPIMMVPIVAFWPSALGENDASFANGYSHSRVGGVVDPASGTLCTAFGRSVVNQRAEPIKHVSRSKERSCGERRRQHERSDAGRRIAASVPKGNKIQLAQLGVGFGSSQFALLPAGSFEMGGRPLKHIRHTELRLPGHSRYKRQR